MVELEQKQREIDEPPQLEAFFIGRNRNARGRANAPSKSITGFFLTQ
jgi:hypothetical protein